MLALIVGFLPRMMGGSRMDTIIVPALDSSRVLTVNRIIIIGNKVTKERIISRELTLKHGDTISVKRLPHELLWDKRKIYNLRLFHTVTVRSLELSNRCNRLAGGGHRAFSTLFQFPSLALRIEILVSGGKTITTTLAAYSISGVNLTRYNFRGRNGSSQLILQFGFTQRYELSYRVPYS